MKNIISQFACSLCILFILTTEINSDLINGGSRISGGENVTSRERFSYQVSIRKDKKHVCGGAIYNPNVIITAASCVKNFTASDLKVYSGDLSLSNPTNNTQKIKVKKIIVHENFSFSNYSDNIALLKLDKSLTINNFTRGSQLYTGNITYGATYVVSGWGARTEGGKLSDSLFSANMTLETGTECLRKLNINGNGKYKYVLNQMICATGYKNNDACIGDVGGPLAKNGSLYGIVSWGFGCGANSTTSPTVFTNVPNYSYWIKTNGASSVYGFNVVAGLILSTLLALFNRF